MAIFTADEYGSAIKRCWLDKRDVTRVTICANISPIHCAGISLGDIWIGPGWVDILDTDDEGHIVANADGKPTPTRHYGTIKLEWLSA